MTKNTYTKSPFNYIGGKYGLLPKLIPMLPENIDTFYDIFGGGFNVGINVKANKIIYNDIVPHVSNIYIELSKISKDDAIEKVFNLIDKYNLSRENEEGFKQLRNDYNNGFNEWYTFYTLVSFSFNNQYRFNNKGEYNSSFGKYKCLTKEVIHDKLSNFIDKLHDINVDFTAKNFKEIDYSIITSDDFVYFDPPYLITTGNYNDGKRGFEGWTKEDDAILFTICDDLNNKGVRFALSNVTHHKDRVNEELINWCNENKYKVTYVKEGFTERHRKGTVEVLIHNF